MLGGFLPIRSASSYTAVMATWILGVLAGRKSSLVDVGALAVPRLAVGSCSLFSGAALLVRMPDPEQAVPALGPGGTGCA